MSCFWAKAVLLATPPSAAGGEGLTGGGATQSLGICAGFVPVTNRMEAVRLYEDTGVMQVRESRED